MGNLGICRVRAGYTYNILFSDQRGLDRDKMKLATNIINAETTHSREEKNLDDLKKRAKAWYDSCSDKINRDEMNNRIATLGNVHLPAKDVQKYARYLGYKVDILAEADGGALVRVKTLKSNDNSMQI